MWIGRAAQKLIETHRAAAFERSVVAAKWEAVARRLELENARLRADADWFQLRLNQVERERGQLIQAAIGVKIAVPEFVPTYNDPSSALHEMLDLSTIGMDAKIDSSAPVSSADPGDGVDYSLMPGYKGDR